MAEALVSDAYRLMSERLADLLQLNDKLKATTGIEGKMEKLKFLSTIIDKVIQEVDSRPFIDDAVKDLLKKLKYLACDLEDVVDHYDTKVLQMQISNASFESVRDFISSDNLFKSRVNCMIKAITQSLDFILLQKSILLNLPQSSSHMSLNPYRETHSRNSFVVIGRETEKNMIVNMLTNDDDDDEEESNHATVKVIAIVGMGGLGKTTLAQLVYNDTRVQEHFASLTMWKIVGPEFNPTKILKSILELATRKSVGISEIDLVRQELETTLSGKRFLLVLDDVWNEDALKWGVLKAALTCGSRGSKILMTTRNQCVSSIMDSSYIHQMKQLSPADCSFLFQKFAFGDRKVDRTLMEIGGKIAKKCGGVPLAAISLGSMLRITRDETYWSSVLNSEIWQLGNEEDKVLAVLKLSYDTLPPRSKKCFTFGSLFPKNYRMAKDELIKLWIANDFVCSEGNFDAETNGNLVFNDLLMGSFILWAPSNVYDDSHVNMCTMHDLMHDLARSVSANAYWNSDQDSVEDVGNRTYHLQIQRGEESSMTQVLGKKPLYLRTFMYNSSRLSINLLEVFSELKFLRALDLRYCGIREVPTSIGNLIHLRYINLSNNMIEVLPDSITLLSNLQYLNLGFNKELRELPKDLGNMQSLRDLDLSSYLFDSGFKLTHMPCGLSRLTNLRSLSVFVAGDGTDACSIIELEDLKLHGEMEIKFSDDFKNYSCGGRKILKNKDLNELCIKFNGSERYDKDMLDDLCPNTSLKKLTISNYGSPQFPTWSIDLQLPNLVEVYITSRFCEHLPPFGNLQFLKKLDLRCMHGIRQMGVEFHGCGGFPSLQELILDGMYILEEWSESHGVNQLFPLLQRVKIINCPELKCMPRLPRIQELEVLWCRRRLLSCVGRLTSLSVLEVVDVRDMVSLPSGCIRNLTFLTKLEIIACEQLQSLPGDEMKHLKMLRSLIIEGCYNLTSFPLEVGHLSSLCFLRLSGCPSIILHPEELVQILNSIPEFEIQICGNKVNLSEQLQHLHTLGGLLLTGDHNASDLFENHAYEHPELCICCCDELELLMTAEAASNIVLEELHINGISNLTTLPDWLLHLKSLSLLSIENCPLLERLPKNLKNIHMLEGLTIDNCPQLESRCKRETGEDWPIISYLNFEISGIAMEAPLLAVGRFMVDKVAILVELDEKLKAITGIKGKMEKLKELSTLIDMVIQDVESHPLNKDAVKDLLRKIKYLAYDLEDVVDYYDTKVLQKKQRSNTALRPVCDFFSSNNQVVFKSMIGGMIKAITDSLDSILLQNSIFLNLPQGSIRTSESNLHEERHSRTSLVVIGRDTEKNMIVDMLTKDDDEDESSTHDTLKVIAIVGMGGLGKTTLAQLVFNDEKVKAHFESWRMWKVVGAEFDRKRLMKSVLELATGKPVNISEIDLVRQELEKTLSGKKFLLVLDDVWNENASSWDVLKAALTCGARGSKVLVTTRSLRVSSIMGSNTTHQIQQLSRDDCLSLFQQSAFGDEAADQKLMGIGGKIVEKCGGVPLAAISLGSMLHDTRDETYWSSVLKSEIWQLQDEEQKVLAVLKWSYDSLPLQSKKCFAFGSLFPKNYMMNKDELIRLWIANGFVSSEGNFDAETLGNRIFDDLVSRSFFLLVPSQDVTECTMHDLMHDLARSVSADVYWNSNQDSVEDIGKRTYHYLQIFPGELPNDMFSQVLSKKPLYLRTFMSQDTSSHLNINLLDVFSKLKFLRVLDLRSNNIKEVPASIGNLIHLRYLNLSWNDIEVLPDSITLLLNLQYLHCNNLRLTYMPRGLSRLINLRCLPHFDADNRSGACSITELEDLKLHGEMTIKFSKNFKNYSCGGRQILKNKHLSELSLHFNCSESNDKDMLDDLSPSTNLKKLSIRNYGSRQFPAWLIESHLPNLLEVSLDNCYGCEHIPPFGNLQFLKKLRLCIMNDIFTQMGAEFHGHGGFPSLRELSLSSIYNLEEWSESDGVDQLFPLLQKLRILRCPKLKSMPRFPKIQELEISYCSESLLSCIGRLSSLSVLKVEDMNDMTSLPSGCIRNLTCLKKLKITECGRLQSLPGDEMQHLEMMRSLTIYSCNNLSSFPSEVERLRSLRLTRSQRIAVEPELLVPFLNSLNKFRIEICGKKVNLRGQLQRLHTLKELLISGKHGTFCFYRKATKLGICCCDELESLMTTTELAASSTVLLEDLYINEFSNLTTLPEWLQHLKSLRILSIRNCQRLERVPRGLKDLSMLRVLKFINCPQLEGRCERETGDDWPIISHVTQVVVCQVPQIRLNIVQQAEG
ncbi:uncharacterized protein LOC121991551 [Zingiber officinale]|uniref:uncharacterized protein LOC121991551 n=1 Tax=Zingiber officinale TaxID=94328 RepID=UPI001C4DC7F4|nr:uncharacterized protein LOC121991551 [Zingiber officinale]